MREATEFAGRRHHCSVRFRPARRQGQCIRRNSPFRIAQGFVCRCGRQAPAAAAYAQISSVPHQTKHAGNDRIFISI